MNTYDPNHIHKKINFSVGQKVVVFNAENQILFLKRSEKCSRPGGWDFPGGGLEEEDPIEGIKREAREEAGIEIFEVKPLSLLSQENKKAKTITLLVGYAATLQSGIVQLSWEHDEYQWLAIPEALKVELPSNHRKFLESAIEFWKEK